MDYKKAYKEALERAKSWHKTNYDNNHIREMLEEILPELKESEDERIRKTLIAYFSSFSGNYYGKLKLKDIVAWLEKQKPVEWSEEDERLCSCLIEEQEESLDNVKNDKYGHSEIISDLKEMYRERIDWLKSIKDRVKPQWKPSEEQMQALAEALSLAKNCGEENAFDLRTLHEQLKNLMEG